MLEPRTGAAWTVRDKLCIVSGGYFFKRKLRSSTAQTRDPDLAQRLWTLSEALVADSAVNTS